MAKKTTPKLPLLTCAQPTRGLLFLGDPHVWSRCPGRRLDNYSKTVLRKLAAAVKIANELNLWPVCLGDLLHQADDNDLAMLSSLISVLKGFDRPLLCAVGNHDLTERALTPGTALELLEQAGALQTLKHNAPYACIDMLDEHNQSVSVLLGATPYGDTIPVSLAAWTGLAKAVDHEQTKKALGVDASVWITHDDLAFDHRYPGAKDTHPIVGVDVAINGHMHLTQKPLRRGTTTWYNPGNFSRLTIDLANQAPRVWAWRPNESRTMLAADGLPVTLLEAIELPHAQAEEVISLAGRAVKQAQLEGQTAGVLEPEEAEELPATGIASSRFVEKLREDQSERRTDDGTMLNQTIQEVIAHRNPPEEIVNIVTRLANKALEQHREQN